jgi:hypothetical protein
MLRYSPRLGRDQGVVPPHAQELHVRPNREKFVVTSHQSSKLNMSPDAFLYACLQSDEARRIKNGQFNSHTRYEPFLFDTYKTPASRTLEGFANELHTILQHHFQTHPQFRRQETIDIETVAHFSQAVATLFFDAEFLIRVFFGRGLPILPATPPSEEDISEDFPALTSAMERFQNYLNNLTEDSQAFSPANDVEDAEKEESDFSREIWYVMDELIKELFGEYAPAFMNFAHHKFAAKEKAAAIDWRVRPPVGSAFIKWRKSVDPDFGRRGRPMGRDDKRGDKRDSGPRGDRNDRGPRPEHRTPESHAPQGEQHAHRTHEGHAPQGERHGHRTHEGHAPQGERHAHRTHEGHAPQGERHGHRTHEGHAPQGERPQRQHREERPFRGDRPDHRPFRDDRPYRGDRPHHQQRNDAPPKSSEADVEAGIQEARAAIEKLRQDSNLSSIPLMPSNSFIRRQQHSLIVEAGFDTESRGEGKERCVHVLRPKN